MIIYRFKTEAEFIKEYQENWRIKVGWSEKEDMDYLFGQEISKKEDENIHSSPRGHTVRISGTIWHIYPRMVKKDYTAKENPSTPEEYIKSLKKKDSSSGKDPGCLEFTAKEGIAAEAIVFKRKKRSPKISIYKL